MNNTNTLDYKKYTTVSNVVLYSKKHNCVKVSFDKYDEKFYTFSIEQFMEINFFPFKFQKDSEDEYPYYLRNNKKNSIIGFLYGFTFNNLKVTFKNGDKNDLRWRNIIFSNHNYYDKIKDKFKIKRYINGHSKKGGSNALSVINPIWVTDDNKYIMYCGNDKHIIFCKKTYDILRNYEKENNKKISLGINSLGYAITGDKIYLQQIFKEYFEKNNIKYKYYINGNRSDNQYNNFFLSEKTELDLLPEIYHNDFLQYYDGNNLIIKDFIEGKYSERWGCNINYKIVVFDKKIKEEYVLFNINPKTFTKISCETLELLDENNNSWYLHKNGYVAGRVKSLKKTLFLHQLITNCYGNGQGIKNISVDHINRDKLDNRISNLRIVDFETQHSNASGIAPGTKRNRKRTAQDLPDGLTQEMMPKYIYFANETIKRKDGTLYKREFFRIEKHPSLEKKCWSSSKSNKLTILEKLEQAKKKLNELDGETVETSQTTQIPEYELPRYITMKKKPNDKIQLIYDRKLNGKRQGMRLTIKNISEKNLDEEVKKFQEAIEEKYS